MNYGRIARWAPFPQEIIDQKLANPDVWDPAKISIGVGFVVELNPECTRWTFSLLHGQTVLPVGCLVSFDVATSTFPVWRQNLPVIKNLVNKTTSACYATNLQKAIAVPSFVNGRLTSWTYQPWTKELADIICASRKRWEQSGRARPTG